MTYLFDKYEVLIYTLYQSLYRLLFSSFGSNYFLFSIFLFCLGFVTILTPCFISLMPLVLSYSNSKGNKYFNKYAFIFGIISSFLLIIILSNFLSLYIFINKLPIVSYLILVFISLNLMQILDFSFIFSFFSHHLMSFSILHVETNSYTIGFVIGLSSLPCNTSIIFIVSFWLTNLSSNFNFLFYLSLYLLGLSLPFFILFNFSFINFEALLLAWKLIFPLSGSFLFTFSLFSLLRNILL
uniref:Thiol:disulfide interchange protein n=1 Tax=Alsidium seaforthii TaxID=2007182 RepID=A0A1Z1MD53_9FLOR|nr:thiol:disulfide interchange protein [Bryothamnion seaforthii]ARW63859.1 thiol:disulfide interchange protein [Bryothamnion seaforthii]